MEQNIYILMQIGMQVLSFLCDKSAFTIGTFFPPIFKTVFVSLFYTQKDLMGSL